MLKKIEEKLSPNFFDLTEKPYIIVLHTTLGSYKGAVEWLRTSPSARLKRVGKKSYSSAHFVIGRLGETSQLVNLDKGAWHAGAVSKPSKRAKDVCRKNVFGKIQNPNRYSVGIELASGYDINKNKKIENWEKSYTPEQIKQCAQLILYIEKELDIKIEDKYILTHQDITSYKPDLENERRMILAELKNLRSKTVSFKDGDKLIGSVVGNKIILEKIK